MNNIWVVDYYGESSGYPELHFFSTYEKARLFYEEKKIRSTSRVNHWAIYEHPVDDPADEHD